MKRYTTCDWRRVIREGPFSQDKKSKGLVDCFLASSLSEEYEGTGNQTCKLAVEMLPILIYSIISISERSV